MPHSSPRFENNSKSIIKLEASRSRPNKALWFLLRDSGSCPCTADIADIQTVEFLANPQLYQFDKLTHAFSCIYCLILSTLYKTIVEICGPDFHHQKHSTAQRANICITIQNWVPKIFQTWVISKKSFCCLFLYFSGMRHFKITPLLTFE